jgi:hypothetical protein
MQKSAVNGSQGIGVAVGMTVGFSVATNSKFVTVGSGEGCGVEVNEIGRATG